MAPAFILRDALIILLLQALYQCNKRKYAEEPYPVGIYNYQAKWIFRLDEGRILGQKMVDMLLCPPYMVAFNSGVEVSEERLLKKAADIYRNASQYSAQELPDVFDEFCNLYYDYYKLAAFTEPTQWHTEYLISNYINKHYKGNITPSEAINALLTTEEDSFALDIIRDLLVCAKLFDTTVEQSVDLREFISTIPHDESFIKTIVDRLFQLDGNPFNELLSKLNDHSSNYHWKKNNYFSTLFISAKDVLVEILEHYDFEKETASNYYSSLINTSVEAKSKQMLVKAEVFRDLPSYYQSIVSISNTIGSSLIDHRKKCYDM